MKLDKLVSLQCSGESFEKSIALFYMSIKDNYNFYKQFDTYVFYGHNLPKKQKSECSQGTIGFYDKYYSFTNYFKYLSKKELIKKKKNILDYLIKIKKISNRNYEKYIFNDELFWNYIKNLPFEYLYPNHYKQIIETVNSSFNVHFIPLHLEDNLLEVSLNISEGKEKYSIYALEYNGKIGRYYLNFKNNKSFCHFCKMLYRKSVLSGNSAILLEQISTRIGKNFIIGYRLHNHDPRPNRDYALNKLLNNNKSIIEPKIIRINDMFKNQDSNISLESKANIVYANAYLEFLNTYITKFSFEFLCEDWWYENR